VCRNHAGSGKTTLFAGSGCCYDNHYLLWPFFLFFQLLLNLRLVATFPFSHPIFSLFCRLLFLTDSFSFLSLFWSIESCEFSRSPSRHGASWLAGTVPNPLSTFRLGTQTDARRHRWTDGERGRDAERCDYLLRCTQYTAHIFFLLSLANCCTILETLNCYLWLKCHSVR